MRFTALVCSLFFDADIIANADVYSGGFSGEFGGRVSSVMDITTRDGNKKRVSGKIGASPFGGKIMVEGPLKNYKRTAAGSVTSFRRSDLIWKRVLNSCMVT